MSHFDTAKNVKFGYWVLEKKMAEDGQNYTSTTLNCYIFLNNRDILDFQQITWSLGKGELSN